MLGPTSGTHEGNFTSEKRRLEVETDCQKVIALAVTTRPLHHSFLVPAVLAFVFLDSSLGGDILRIEAILASPKSWISILEKDGIQPAVVGVAHQILPSAQ
jgi:hypothetical protein